MRKVKFLLITLLVSMVALTGCGKKNELTPEETLKKAQDAMKTVDNYKMDMVVSIGFNGQGASMNIDMNLNGIVDEKNGKTKMTMSTNLLGQNINKEMYTDTKTEEGKIISYTKQEDNTWIKSVSDNEEASANVTKAMQEIISSGNNVKKVKADSKDVYTYEITIPVEKFVNLMNMTENDSMSAIDKENLKGDITLKVSIDKSTNQFTKFYMDMKEILSSSMDVTEEIKIEISKAEFIINFSDYNKVGDITIPSDVIENAKDDEIGFDFGDNNFAEFDEDNYEQVLVCNANISENGNNVTATTKVGFNNDMSEDVYTEAEYTFENSEEAQTFYDELIKDDSVNVFKFDNNIEVSYFEEISSDQQASYSDVKTDLESEGFNCQ